MCKLICDVQLLFQATTWGKINVYTKIVTENQKRENMEIKQIFT